MCFNIVTSKPSTVLDSLGQDESVHVLTNVLSGLITILGFKCVFTIETLFPLLRVTHCTTYPNFMKIRELQFFPEKITSPKFPFSYHDNIQAPVILVHKFM